MKNNKLQLASTILFFGAFWGILEATLGYVLHFVPTFLAGTIMFPIVSVILVRAYAKTGSKMSLLWIGVVSALIKSVNLFMPAFSIWKTINPMISIVVESLMVIVVLTLLNKENHLSKIMALPIASLLWRGAFLGALAIQFAFNGYLSSQLATLNNSFQFLIVSGLFSGALASVFYYLSIAFDKKVTFTLKLKPIVSLLTFVLAIVLTILL